MTHLCAVHEKEIDDAHVEGAIGDSKESLLQRLLHEGLRAVLEELGMGEDMRRDVMPPPARHKRDEPLAAACAYELVGVLHKVVTRGLTLEAINLNTQPGHVLVE